MTHKTRQHTHRLWTQTGAKTREEFPGSVVIPKGTRVVLNHEVGFGDILIPGADGGTVTVHAHPTKINIWISGPCWNCDGITSNTTRETIYNQLGKVLETFRNSPASVSPIITRPARRALVAYLSEIIIRELLAGSD